jgi:O-antigen/teichoic acid export membrane protein
MIAAGLLALICVLFFGPGLDIAAVFTGYGIGFLAIGLHYVMSSLSKRWENETFLALYTPLSMVRLLLVLGIFIVLIILGKFDQFSFTVSFLISYIYHSVINILLLNRSANNRPG